MCSVQQEVTFEFKQQIPLDLARCDLTIVFVQDDLCSRMRELEYMAANIYINFYILQKERCKRSSLFCIDPFYFLFLPRKKPNLD